jgi:glutamyl-tRNA synthetase
LFNGFLSLPAILNLSMERKVRVRFAPSPTGPLHMGGVRTALYNYLFAKKNNGDFLLRIEDTDQTRFVPGAEEYIIEALNWCGITPNEGPGMGGEFSPYRQSERKPLYRQYAEQLISSGYAYYAFDTAEELEQMREKLKAAKVASPQYNAVTRNSMKNSLTLSEDEVNNRLSSGDAYVIRLKVPRNEEVRLNDIIRGWVVVHTANMDDKVLFKSDGMPTYHLANVVDDYLMKITHVIRGEEWLPSAPLHVLLYKYLGWEEVMPQFAHLPLLLRPDGNGKLSKRDGDRLGFPVFPLNWTDPEIGEKSSGYRERGYFPEAFINMLAFLGWNPGTAQEIFSLGELVEAFSLDRVSKSGAKFDHDKTKWYNQQYLRAKTNEELAELVKPLITTQYPQISSTYLAEVCRLMKERATFVNEIAEEGDYFFTAPEKYDSDVVSKKWKPDTKNLLLGLKNILVNETDFSAVNIEKVFKDYVETNKLGMGAVMLPLRIVLSGKGAGPSVFEIAALIGKEETINRISKGIEKLG